MILLSILVPSVHSRRNTFLPKSLEMLYGQWEKLSTEDQNKVEILYLVDNKTSMLGDKRNSLVNLAQGKYVCQIDDDDRISDQYITELLAATTAKTDVIVFQAAVSINGETPKICYYDKNIGADYNTHNGYHRLPNHIVAVKKSIAEKVPFPSLTYAEDRMYARLLKPHLTTQYKINKVLYYYDYNDLTTVAQEDLPLVKRKRRMSQPPIVDIVMLSNAKTPALRAMTEKAINSCICGANGLPVNVIVVEQQPHVSYEDAKTVYHSAEFNYSAFNNLGAAQGSAEWILFANNDIVCHNGYLHALLAANHPVVSSREPKDVRQKDVTKNEKGWENGKHLSPWFFMLKRDLFEQINGWDESFTGWFSDNAFLARLKKANEMPMVVFDSVVDHLGSVTTNTLLNARERSNFAWDKLELYNQRYNDNLFTDNPNFILWKNRQGSSTK